MAHAESDYHHGEMNISEQAATYRRFGAMSKWGSLIIATGLLFFALLFCTQTGFMGSAIPAVVLLAAGIFFLRSKPSDSH